MDLLAEFRCHLATIALPRGSALVAVSGGPDSVALLDLLLRSRDLHGLQLVVAHFDHGIHPDSAPVAEGVRALAAAHGLAFECGHGALGSGAGETAARAARYAWLESARARREAAAVVTAHHAGDQIETVLMRALAGSGPAGLAGMGSVAGRLIRPLLPFRREALARYVRMRGLPVWLDPANADPRHLRSWLRCEVLPLLRTRLPEVDRALEGVAGQAARDRAAWNGVLDLLPGLDLRREEDGISVAGGCLSGYDSALGETLLIAAARRAGCRLGAARAARVLRLLRRGASGSELPLADGWNAEVAFGRLRLVRAEARGPGESPPVWRLEGESGDGAWGRWRLCWRREVAPEHQARASLSAWFVPSPLTVRAWAAGEKLHPLAGAGRRLIVRCFQDARVPRSRRERWPVLAGPDGAVWIPGVCRSDAFLPLRGTEALRVDAEYA